MTLLIAFALPAFAQGVATFSYQRSQIHILRAAPTVEAAPVMPWQSPSDVARPVNAPLPISVDVRPSTSLYQQAGWMNTGQLAANSGMLFVFESPQMAAVGRMEYYQPLDVFWVDAGGTITSIAPGMMLTELVQPVADSRPSKAVLILAGGTVDAQNIKPGDKIVGSEYFQEPAKVLTSPVAEPTAIQPVNSPSAR